MASQISPGDGGFGIHIPFVAMLGLQLQRFENGESELFLPYKPAHDNSFAVIHGGTLMTVLDVAMASAARSVDATKGVLTIEMKTSFMQAVRGDLWAHGRLLHRTQRMAFVEATVFDAAKARCAHATATFRYVDRQRSGQTNAPIATD
ncbi:MAG: PaaI family thioesterase [Betaproteobacteria bacterium]|nr:PaaI family thioesterase [Betaproteobacteria bacterium]